MKSILWPTLLLITLWVIMTAILPGWMSARYVPNLILAGVLVLAVTHFDGRTIVLTAVFGLFLDIHSSLLMGSYTLAFPLLYWLTHFIFVRFVPSDRMNVALPVTYMITELLLKGWVYGIGLLATLVGWPIQPLFTLHGGLYSFFSLVMGGVLSVAIYVVWLEITHRFDKPLRLRR